MEQISPSSDMHEWVSFEDADESRTWIFDITFLTSNWNCIFGRGCQGVLTGPAPELVQGCCSYGAHLLDKSDAKRVKEAASTLTEDQWQFYKQGNEKGVIEKNKDGEQVTRIVKDACIFLNRVDFEKGPGCALHLAAINANKNPLELKPDVCWQLPLRREDRVDDDDHVTSTICQWDRKHWGQGGAEFHWWCTQEPDAFNGGTSVYESMAEELTKMVGAKVYEQLGAYIKNRIHTHAKQAFLAHPALRRRS